eukprot:m.8673 g.8673  ORF g.8673 m.8673 type:complete len:2246 (+) comp3940_c0_seq1:246-6983(+)
MDGLPVNMFIRGLLLTLAVGIRSASSDSYSIFSGSDNMWPAGRTLDLTYLVTMTSPSEEPSSLLNRCAAKCTEEDSGCEGFVLFRIWGSQLSCVWVPEAKTPLSPCPVDYILCVSYKKLAGGAGSLDLPDEGACDYKNSGFSLEYAATRTNERFLVETGGFIFKHIKPDGQSGQLNVAHDTCNKKCRDDPACNGYDLDYPFLTGRWPSTSDRYICWGLKDLKKTTSNSHTYSYRRNCPAPLDAYTCNGVSDQYWCKNRADSCDQNNVANVCPAVCSACVQEKTTTSQTTRTTQTTVSLTTKTTTTKSTTTKSSVTKSTTTMTTTTETSFTFTTTATVTTLTATQTTVTGTTISTTKTSVTTSNTITSSTTQSSVTFTTTTKTSVTSSQTSISQTTITDSTVTLSTVTSTITTNTVTTVTFTGSTTTKTTVTGTTVTTTKTSVTDTTFTTTITTITGTMSSLTSRTLTETTTTSTSTASSVSITDTLTSSSKTSSTGTVSYTSATATITSVTSITSSTVTKSTLTVTTTTHTTTVPANTVTQTSDTMFEASMTSTVSSRTKTTTKTTVSDTMTTTVTSTSSVTLPWKYVFYSDLRGGSTGRFSSALLPDVQLFKVPSLSNPGPATPELCQSLCDDLRACQGFYLFQQDISTPMFECHGLSDLGEGTVSCDSAVCISYEKRFPSTTGTDTSATSVSSVTTTISTITTMTTSMLNCEGCAASTSGPCIFSGVDICSDVGTDGKCPAGSILCSDLVKQKKGKSTFCIGEAGSGSNVRSFFGTGALCQESPYNFPFTRASFDAYTETPADTRDFFRYCFGTNTESVADAPTPYSRSFFRVLGRGESCGASAGYESSEVYLPKTPQDDTVSACVQEETVSPFRLWVQILGRREGSKVEAPCQIPTSSSWKSPVYLNLIDFCAPGLKSDLLRTCKDRDECAEGIDLCDIQHATCHNSAPPVHYLCTCKNGYEPDDDEDFYIYGIDMDDLDYVPEKGKTCADINECNRATHDCDVNAQCDNTEGSFACSCNVGWEDDVSSTKNGTLCTDIDECLRGADSCHPNALCNNTLGSFVCECMKGYQGNGTHCLDFDECVNDTDDCDENALCSNNDGSFTCSCQSGWKPSSQINVMNGTVCFDVDECESAVPVCPAVAQCENLQGSFQCNCNPGYQTNLSTSECENIDECALATNDCGANTDCIDDDGSFSCECRDGWKTLNVTECQDFDECVESTSPVCDNFAECFNNNGSFTCACLPGYNGTGYIGECDQIDECLNDQAHNCNEHATCRDIGGGFECGQWRELSSGESLFVSNSCNIGWTGDGVSCTDLDECNVPCTKESPPCAVCPNNGECANLEGSFQCNCNDGFEHPKTGIDNDVVCENINECDESNNCHENAECRDETPFYSCACNNGYTGDGTTCEDVDECLDTINMPCGARSICENIMGSFSCSCQEGFVDSSNTGPDEVKVCDDINECAASTDPCDENAQCSNTFGSYTCLCNLGYSGSGLSCSNINECFLPEAPGEVAPDVSGSGDPDSMKLNPDACHPLANCIDTAGSYLCECKTGYEPEDGPGAILSASDRCVNVDECAGNPCMANSKCIDEVGSFVCSCDPGYENAPGVCIDINECENPEIKACCEGGVNITLSERIGVCENRLGFYDCNCPNGYEMERTECGKQCVNQDECTTSRIPAERCSPYASCVDVPGSFDCQCRDGYIGDGETCIDVNECDLDMDTCTPRHPCINTDGSYFCECGSSCNNDGCPGWEWDSMNQDCLDINECEENGCLSTQLCQNLRGTHNCLCVPPNWVSVDNDLDVPTVTCEAFEQIWLHSGQKNLSVDMVYSAMVADFGDSIHLFNLSRPCHGTVKVAIRSKDSILSETELTEVDKFLKQVTNNEFSVTIGGETLDGVVTNICESVGVEDVSNTGSASWLVVGLVLGVTFFCLLFAGSATLFNRKRQGSADLTGPADRISSKSIGKTRDNARRMSQISSRPTSNPVLEPAFISASGSANSAPYVTPGSNDFNSVVKGLQTFVAYSHENLINLAHTMSWMHGPYYGGAKTLSQAENTLMQYAKQDGVFIVFTNEDPLQSDQVNSGYTLLYTVDGSTVSVSIKYNQNVKLTINGHERGPWRLIENLISDVLDAGTTPDVPWLHCRLQSWVDRVSLLPIDISDTDELIRVRFPELFLVLQAAPQHAPVPAPNRTSVEYYRALAESRYRHSTHEGRRSASLSPISPNWSEGDYEAEYLRNIVGDANAETRL